MPDTDRLTRLSSAFESDFVECERTSRRLTQLSIRLHLAELSLSDIVSEIEAIGVVWSRKAVHDWVQKADLQPAVGKSPDHVALDETAIQIDDERFWLYAAVDPESNHVLHVRLYPRRKTVITELFVRELREKRDVEDADFLVDSAPCLQTTPDRHGLRFRHVAHGNRNAVECIYSMVNRSTS